MKNIWIQKSGRKGLLLLLLAAALLGGCASSSDGDGDTSVQTGTESQTQGEDTQKAEQELFAMDTYMTLTAYGDQAQEAVNAAAEEIERLDALLSTGSTDSEVGQLNESGSGVLSEDTAALAERALTLWEETDGLFDIAIYPVMEAWGFPTEDYQVPDEDTLKELLPLTDASEISFDSESGEISFGKEGMKIDFGGIAKGYTSSRIMEIYQEYGIESGMVNLGGNVQTLGTKTDGTRWKVAVQDPEDTDGYLGVLETQDRAVITSGGYERYFEQDGETYHHIIDPRTGYPADSGLISVTIVSDDGTLADGLSTSLFIMGKDDAEEFWRAHSEEFDAILVTEDKKMYVTEGIAEDFTAKGQVEVIEK